MKEVKVVWVRNHQPPSAVDVANKPIPMNNEEAALARLLDDGWHIASFALADRFFYLVIVRDQVNG